MNISIPFEKIIPFKSNIAEICSISLEHDISINDNELLGDFLVTGEYKNLDVNVDTQPFEYVVPFRVNLDEDIIIDTLNYDIEDFTYEIKNNDSLSVKIIFHVSAEKKEPTIPENIFERETIDEEDRLNLINENQNEEKETINLDEIIENNNNNENNEHIENNINIINSNNIKEDYITYHIHVTKANETIDSISNDYKIDKEKLMELNDLTQIQIGDKIIIPDNDES